MNADILIIDDEADIRGLIQGILQDEHYATRQAANSDQAYAHIAERIPQLVILDIWLQNSVHDGLEILRTIKEQHPFMPVIMISGHGTIETAVSAIKQGAYDFIEKPFKTDRLLLMIERALEAANLKRENEALRKRAEGPSEFIGESLPVQGLKTILSRVALTNSRILLTGEPGTGKDVAARVIHRLSQRANQPFMTINCAVLRPEHLEIELFGVEQGNVHGETARAGVFEQAHGGTLLLDEVADMPLETQGKIVRVLQEQRFQRVGGQNPVQVDVRIIASTNRDLKELIVAGSFREDLFYRLNVVPITMPPLRERREDIPLLASFFVDMLSQQSGLPACSFSAPALAALQSYEWPGNVRQLRNVIEWIMIMGGNAINEPVRSDQLPPDIIRPTEADKAGRNTGDMAFVSLPLREARESFEKDYLEFQIKRFSGNISKTAQFVEMERSALHRKLKQLGISDLPKQNSEEEAESLPDMRKIGQR